MICGCPVGSIVRFAESVLRSLVPPEDHKLSRFSGKQTPFRPLDPVITRLEGL